jgi:hypothetical protein
MTDRYAQLFDFDEGQRLKAEGMTQAAEQVPTLLEKARQIAVQLCQEQGFITIDDVHAALSESEREILGNAAGSIFRGSHWAFSGDWQPSTRTTNHGRYVRVWRLKP